MKIELKVCPYCKGIAKRYIKIVESFTKYIIIMWYVQSVEHLQNGIIQNLQCCKMGNSMYSPQKKRLRKLYMTGIFDTQTKLLHMAEQEKIL